MTSVLGKRKIDEEVMKTISSAIPLDLLECVACKDTIDPEFVRASCNHRACKACWTKCARKCPVCRKFDRHAKPDDLAVALLKMYPRVTDCGETVCGSTVSHEDSCTKCLKIKLQSKTEENRVLSLSLTNRMADVTRLTRRVDVLEAANRQRNAPVAVDSPSYNYDSDTENEDDV